MNILRSGLVVALFSVMNSFPCYVCAMGEPTSSAVFTEVSNCSELTSGVDRDLCTRHLSALKDLIREKNNQASLSTSTAAPPIPETIRIRKISATNTRLDQEVFRTIYPTLFIFDSEQPTGNGQSAIYELPLTERDNGLFRSANSFQLPANSAFVGNRVDILPEFVINGGGWFHYVMSASCNDSVYYLANIKVNSRSPSDMGRSSTAVATVPPGSTPTERLHVPAGVLDLRGAGIFVADNIKVVLDPADNQRVIRPVHLGCTDNEDGRGAKELFVYRFTHSEFDLLQGMQRPTHDRNAALSVHCYTEGQVQLTLKNTKTVVSLPTETDTPTPESVKSSGVLFDLTLLPRENVLHLVDCTCNSIVDQFGNDLSIDSANPSDPAPYMGGIWYARYCYDDKVIRGAFGLKGRDEAWGLIDVDPAASDRCSNVLAERYQLGFASVGAWSSAGFDVACHSDLPTSTATQDKTPVSSDISDVRRYGYE